MLTSQVRGGNIEIKDGTKGESKVDWRSSTSLHIRPRKRNYFESSRLIENVFEMREGMPISLEAFGKAETEKTSWIEIKFPDWNCKLPIPLSQKSLSDMSITSAKRSWTQNLRHCLPLWDAWQPAKSDPERKGL